ncbi:hypothetical protein Tco_1094663 [Tanacetum coccineum]|uniref:Integrase, catalytic region, zinc finger, CCHC-type, peptidase aspartic, catalytic n=1 Tax=Tanacetum coccineum TaxID=301880 RepID=A0ABQ5IGL8_9ASTR
MSKVHDESKLISKLERECLNLQLKYQHLQESFDNKNSQASQEAPDFNSFFKIKNLEHQIKEKDNVIRHLKDLVASVNDRSREPHNDVDVTALIEQNDCDRVELEKVKQHYKELYDSIKINRAHTSEKTSTMLNEIESLKAQLRSKEPYIGYQWRPTGKKLTLGKLDCGSQWRPTGKKFALGEICQFTKLSVKCRTGHALVSGLRLLKTYDGGNRAIMGYGDYVMGDSVISRVYYVEGLGHNLFSVGQFCDSDLEVAFRKHTCFVRDINGTDILKGHGLEDYKIEFEKDHLAQLPVKLENSKKDTALSWMTWPTQNWLRSQRRKELGDVISKPNVCTSLSTTNAQIAPSTSASSSTSGIHLPVQHQEIAEEPTQEDTPIIHDVLPPPHNLVTGDPGSAQSSSGNVYAE